MEIHLEKEVWGNRLRVVNVIYSFIQQAIIECLLLAKLISDADVRTGNVF